MNLQSQSIEYYLNISLNTVFENHPKMSHLNFFHFCKKFRWSKNILCFTYYIAKWDFLSDFQPLCLLSDVYFHLLCKSLKRAKKKNDLIMLILGFFSWKLAFHSKLKKRLDPSHLRTFSVWFSNLKCRNETSLINQWGKVFYEGILLRIEQLRRSCFSKGEDNLWCERYGGNKKAVFLLVQPQMGRKWLSLS